MKKVMQTITGLGGNCEGATIATPETNETCVLMAKIKNKTHNLKVA